MVRLAAPVKDQSAGRRCHAGNDSACAMVCPMDVSRREPRGGYGGVNESLAPAGCLLETTATERREQPLPLPELGRRHVTASRRSERRRAPETPSKPNDTARGRRQRRQCRGGTVAAGTAAHRGVDAPYERR